MLDDDCKDFDFGDESFALDDAPFGGAPGYPIIYSSFL